VSLLEEKCRAVHAKILVGVSAREPRRANEFVVTTDREEFRAPALVVATVGLSVAKMGATSFGYEIARRFGVKLRECRPGLVPLTF
jgi:predicted flavoprotein YhiN